MSRTNLPFYYFASAAASKLVGRDLERVAVKALRAILLNGKGLEVAHQQIRWGEHFLAFSSRVTRAGELVVDLDLGDPSLSHRIVLESELREKMRQTLDTRGDGPRRRWPR